MSQFKSLLMVALISTWASTVNAAIEIEVDLGDEGDVPLLQFQTTAQDLVDGVDIIFADMKHIEILQPYLLRLDGNATYSPSVVRGINLLNVSVEYTDMNHDPLPTQQISAAGIGLRQFGSARILATSSFEGPSFIFHDLHIQVTGESATAMINLIGADAQFDWEIGWEVPAQVGVWRPDGAVPEPISVAVWAFLGATVAGGNWYRRRQA